jgi:hypothetical protein
VQGGGRHQRPDDEQWPPWTPAPQRLVGEVTGQKEAPCVRGLQMRQARQQVGVERDQGARDKSGARRSGPSRYHPPPRQARGRQSHDEQEIEDQHGRTAQPHHGRTHQRRHDQRFGEGQRPFSRLEDVPFPECRWMCGQGVRDPTHNPRIQLRVGIVIEREVMRGRCQWPGVEDSQRHKDQCCRNAPRSGTGHSGPRTLDPVHCAALRNVCVTRPISVPLRETMARI